MADYKQTQIAGESHVRAKSVLLENPKGGQGTISFEEEKWYELGGDTVSRPIGWLRVPFDPQAVIALRDPRTGDLIGQDISQGSVYAAIYSLYVQLATQRDEALLAAQQATEATNVS